MAKFQVKIELGDGTVIEDITAEMPDVTIGYLVAASEALGQVDTDGSPVVGIRAVSTAVRWFLTDLTRSYVDRSTRDAASKTAKEALDSVLSEIVVVKP